MCVAPKKATIGVKKYVASRPQATSRIQTGSRAPAQSRVQTKITPSSRTTKPSAGGVSASELKAAQEEIKRLEAQVFSNQVYSLNNTHIYTHMRTYTHSHTCMHACTHRIQN